MSVRGERSSTPIELLKPALTKLGNRPNVLSSRPRPGMASSGSRAAPLNPLPGNADQLLVRARIEIACLGAFAIAASVYATFHQTFIGDYEVDGAPTLHALIHGHIHAPAPAMGSLSIWLRLPFVWLVRDSSVLTQYRAGSLACV